MNIKPALIASLVAVSLFGTPVFADAYISVGANVFNESVDAPPEITAQHPVDRAAATEYDETFGISVLVGYRWESGWYINGGWSDMDDLEHRITQFGPTGGATRQETMALRNEDAATVEARLGRLIALTDAVHLYAEAGVHRYHNTITLGERNVERDHRGNVVNFSSSETATSVRGTDLAYGLGIVFNLSDVTRLKIGMSHYAGIDRTPAMFMFQVNL